METNFDYKILFANYQINEMCFLIIVPFITDITKIQLKHKKEITNQMS